MLNDTDDTWHHDTLLAIVSKNNKISGGFIREPQWKILTFATSMKMNDGAPSAAKNCFQAWQNFLAAQRVKIGRSESAKTINIK